MNTRRWIPQTLRPIVNRGIVIAGGLALLLVAALACDVRSQNQTSSVSDELVVQSLRLVDASGRTRATLGLEPESGDVVFQMYSSGSAARLRVQCGDERAGLVLFGEDDSTRLMFEHNTKSDATALVLQSRIESESAFISAHVEGKSPNIQVRQGLKTLFDTSAHGR